MSIVGRSFWGCSECGKHGDAIDVADAERFVHAHLEVHNTEDLLRNLAANLAIAGALCQAYRHGWDDRDWSPGPFGEHVPGRKLP